MGIGQAHHGRDTTGHSRFAAGLERLLVFLARLAQLHAHVDEAGSETKPVAVHHFDAPGHAVGEQVWTEFGDRFAIGEQGATGVQAARRIQQPGIHIGDAGGGALRHQAVPPV